jgi:chemotaxis protein methyltransferase CheR
MLESRLQKRLKKLEINSFSLYCDFLFSQEGLQNELLSMIDLVTTNKTDFFREPVHFDYLSQNLLPQFANSIKNQGNRIFKFWSAGCSTGEEPYTLAMVLNEFKEINPEFNYKILATDLSATALKKAQAAVYELSRVEPVPLPLKRKYLLKNKDKTKNLVRIVAELRMRVEFRRMNFLESNYAINDMMDLIFCRNVIIYFDRKTQERVINNMVSNLRPGGYFVSGHSETLSGMDIPIKQVAPTIHRKI